MSTLNRSGPTTSPRALPAFALSLLLVTILADRPIFTDLAAFDSFVDEHDGFAYQTFHSSPIRAPVFHVNVWDRARTDPSPFIFIGSFYGAGGAGPMILDARDLSLVYADQKYSNAYHSDVQSLRDQTYYTFWEGARSRGHANGRCVFVDETYERKYAVEAQNRPGVLADMHEMRTTADGTVLFSTYFNIPYDTDPVGGKVDSLLMDSGFQEVDPVINEVIFDWAASDHFDITDSFAPYSSGYGVGPDSGYDFFHINSVEKVSHLLIVRQPNFRAPSDLHAVDP